MKGVQIEIITPPASIIWYPACSQIPSGMTADLVWFGTRGYPIVRHCGSRDVNGEFPVGRMFCFCFFVFYFPWLDGVSSKGRKEAKSKFTYSLHTAHNCKEVDYLVRVRAGR